MLRTEAVKLFLSKMTHPDLAALYGPNMECHVNVAQDNGERIEGEFKGKKWQGWTDGNVVWKPFWIPHNANKNPVYEDRELKYPLEHHVEGIGMTGWDWVDKVSRWVAFDFDAIVGHSKQHSKKLTQAELEEVKNEASKIPWVEIRLSTSGTGLHLYVHITPVSTSTHTEHAALARAILAKLGAITGFDFEAKIDVCGSNMWVWHRKMQNTDGLKLIKKGEILTDIPINWKDHLDVITRKSARNRPLFIDPRTVENMDTLTNESSKIRLDEQHKKLINYLDSSGAFWWWDSDRWMLVTHTIHLKEAHEKLQTRGYFKTLSTGKERGMDHNCFLYPMPNGAWVVRRFTRGCLEDKSWMQDSSGWTRTYFNRIPDFDTACKAFDGVQDPKGGYHFDYASDAAKAAELLGVKLSFDKTLESREAQLKKHKTGKLITEIKKESKDSATNMQGWLCKDNKPWTQMSDIVIDLSDDTEIEVDDNLLRHTITEANIFEAWRINVNSKWIQQPLGHIRAALTSMNMPSSEVTNTIGAAIMKPWIKVNKPFQPEYPGNREWNYDAAQLRYKPSLKKENLQYPTWSKVLNHCGKGLDDSVRSNGWCKANGILTGGDYLKCWIASLIQHPYEPLPFLFFYSPEQNTGKTTFHESMPILFTKGIMKAESAIRSGERFNAEIFTAIVCTIEEIDLGRDKAAYNKIKDWVTSSEILIHEKNGTPYIARNSTHWIQCANDLDYCPVYPGDTRIVVCRVPKLNPIEIIPPRIMKPQLEKEAPDFLAELLKLDIPESNDRLMLPILETTAKRAAVETNTNIVEAFIRDCCKPAPGYSISIDEFYSSLQVYIDSEGCTESEKWTKIKVSKLVQQFYPKGRMRGSGRWHYGNIAFREVEIEQRQMFTLNEDYLEQEGG